MPYQYVCYNCGYEHEAHTKCPRCRRVRWLASAMMIGGLLALAVLFASMAHGQLAAVEKVSPSHTKRVCVIGVVTPPPSFAEVKLQNVLESV